MEKWELRQRLIEDKRLADVLRTIRDIPRTSTNKLIKNSGLAGMTVKRKISALESLDLIVIEGEKKQACGKPNLHRITDLGTLILAEIEKIPNPAAFVRMVYSDKYLEKLSEKNASEIQRIFADPRIKNAISILISTLVFKVLEKEPGCAVTYLEDYADRLYFIGDLSKKDSRILKFLIEEHVFSEESLAMKHIIITGMQLLKELKKKIDDDPESFFTGKTGVLSLVTFKFDTKTKTLQPIRAKFKKISKKKYLIEFP